MIRSIRPTDLASLLAFLRRGLPNDAKTGRNLGQRERLFSLGRFLEEWLSLDENRYTWIDISRGRIKGLISVRSRPSHLSWQVDSLILGAGPEEDGDICLRLLEYVSVVGGEVGVQKVFLRIERSSTLADVARQAGLLPYKTELLYWRESLASAAGEANVIGQVRLKRPVDELALFQLYSAAVPGHVRQAEAMTFDEWKAISKKNLSLPTQQDLVLEREGNLVGWLRVRRGGKVNSFDILALPQERETLAALLGYCLGLLDQRRPTYCLLSDYREDLRLALEEKGFCLAGEYSSLVKQLAARVRQPRFVPARV